MASTPETTARRGRVADSEPILEAGDRLSRDEFEGRYERMPHVKKAELIEGTVYLPSPTRAKQHAGPHIRLAGWLLLYASELPGQSASTTLRCGWTSTTSHSLTWS